MRRIVVPLFVVLALFSCSLLKKSGPDSTTSLGPPSSGTIAGVVRFGGSPLPGVTVTVSGNGAGSRSTYTDARGRYRFVTVAPGVYTMTFELAGLRRESVRVNVAGRVPLDLVTELQQASVSEAITVSAAAPAVLGGVVGGVVDQATFSASRAQGVSFRMKDEAVNTAEYAPIAEHGFVDAGKEAVTTFAIDVDRASYANVRRFLTSGLVPPPDAVRIEEMLNYFSYSYPQPAGPHPFSVTTEVASCPWAPDHRLLRIGIQGRNLDEWRLAPNNLVFLVDVSGSMQPPARLPLIKSGLRLLVDRLRAEDKVSIVVYAGAAGVVLPPTSGADKQTILAALDRLNAGGSTAGGAGIQLAYETAQANFISGGNNRVILATDGDFNVGVTNNDDLLKLIDEKRRHGIYLTAIGVGDDNFHDARLEMLADKGDGNYSYLDNVSEAEKVFVRELTGTLVTIAKDVKVQLEFDPQAVRSYRQIGYENRALQNQDFDDDSKDAGELGAGHSVTALYEIVPNGAPHGRVATLRLRYKQPAGSTSELLTATAEDQGRNIYEASPDLQFAAAVAEFGMLLRKSPHAGTSTYADALALARAARGVDLDGTREEFLRLVETSRAITGEVPQQVTGQ